MDYSKKGSTVTVAVQGKDMEIYITGTGTKAIIVHYDIFGADYLQVRCYSCGQRCNAVRCVASCGDAAPARSLSCQM